MSTKVTGNLLVRTILSPVLDFNDESDVGGTTQGDLNVRTLVKRVKKLDKSERQELMAELQHISARMDAPEGLQPTDLRERGLAVLLLSDDGMPLQKKGTLMRICLGISNIIGWRISSDAIIKELIAVRASLEKYTDEVLPELSEASGKEKEASSSDMSDDDKFTSIDLPNEIEIDNRTVISTLKQSKRDLIQKLNAPNGNKKMGEMNRILSTIGARLASLPVKSGKENDVYQDRYINVIASVGLMPGMVKENPLAYFDAVNFAQRMTNVKVVLEVLADATDDKTVAEFILTNFNSLSDKDKAALEAVRDNDAALRSQNGGDFARVFLKNYVCREVQLAYHKFDEKICNTNNEQAKVQADIRDIQRNLGKLRKNLAIQDQREALEFAIVCEEKAESLLSNINEILGKIALIPKDKSFAFLQAYINSAYLRIERSKDGEIKNTKDFLGKLSYIKDLLNLSITDHSELAKSIELERYLDEHNSSCYLMLSDFITDKHGNINTGRFSSVEDEQEYRKKLAGAYIEYLTKVFETELKGAKGSYQEAIEQTKVAAQEMEKLLQNVVPVPLPIQTEPVQTDGIIDTTHTPPPVIIRPQPPLQTASPISKVPNLDKVPTSAVNGKTLGVRLPLLHIAQGVETNLANDAAAKSHYSQVKGMTAEGLNGVIYQNFYFIMLNAGKIQNGNDNWGELVFLADDGTDLMHFVQNVTPAELNEYRLEALVMAINGLTRTA